MRDLLSKLDAIVSETELKNPEDLQAKRKALADLEKDPVAGKDPEISSAIAQRKTDLEREAKSKGFAESFQIGDEFGISFSEDHEIATTIVDMLEDGIVIELDDLALEMLTNEGLHFLDGELEESVAGPKKCWKGYRKTGTQPGTGKNAGKRVNDCEKIGEDLDESGLQRYTGIKKYGKDGFEALQKAGRDGADEEEKGRIKDKYLKKEDHGPENPDAPVNYGEYDREGDMAKDDLRTIDDAVEELYSILQADDNLPEWVQAKITKAVDYIDTARDYMKAQNYEEGLPQTLRKVVPGYAKREIDKKMDDQKFGRTDVDKDANYYRYKKIQDKIKNKGVAEGEQDPQTELKMINQKLKDAYKRVRNNSSDSSASIGWYTSEVKALNARREELIKQLKQGVAEGYDEWNARELEKSRTRHPDGTGSTPSKTLAKLMRIPGFSKVSPAEQQRVAKAVDRYLARDMSFDQALVLAQKKGVAEAAKHGLYYNVNKRKAAGTSRPASSPKAPTAQAWKDAAKTAKKEDVAEGDVDEAKYHGREVPLGKKMAGDVKKSKVYVRKPNGNIVKVNFGDKKMRIKKSNPARRKSFRARHNCANPGPRDKARYWSCRSW